MNRFWKLNFEMKKGQFFDIFVRKCESSNYFFFSFHFSNASIFVEIDVFPRFFLFLLEFSRDGHYFQKEEGKSLKTTLFLKISRYFETKISSQHCKLSFHHKLIRFSLSLTESSRLNLTSS